MHDIKLKILEIRINEIDVKLTRGEGGRDVNPIRRAPFWHQSQRPLVASFDNSF